MQANNSESKKIEGYFIERLNRAIYLEAGGLFMHVVSLLVSKQIGVEIAFNQRKFPNFWWVSLAIKADLQ